MFQIAVVLLAICVMTLAIPHTKKRTEEKLFRLMIWGLFACYVYGNAYFTLLSRVAGTEVQHSLIPFRTLFRLFTEKPLSSWSDSLQALVSAETTFLAGTNASDGLFLNVFLYYPMGYLLPILFPKIKSKHVILIGCLCAIVTEVTQYFLKLGLCETDDVIHNTLGTVLGVWVWHIQARRLNIPAE